MISPIKPISLYTGIMTDRNKLPPRQVSLLYQGGQALQQKPDKGMGRQLVLERKGVAGYPPAGGAYTRGGAT
jgi:hypothetical protein